MGYDLRLLFGDYSPYGEYTLVKDLCRTLLRISRTFEVVTVRIKLMMDN